LNHEDRALELHKLALALVEAQGRFITVGLLTYKELRSGRLGIRYLPSTCTLDIWLRQKVLMVTSSEGKPKVAHFVPGEWEEELEALATKPLKK